jgi:4-amino-4-deoxy-L-arabinose transferase-like glycosyltransferase
MKIDKFWINRALLLILLVSIFLRFYRLSQNPPSLTPDEAALGYNAYSLLSFGTDEYGTRFPLIFKSFGDYKPGLYIYFTIPFVALFGLNEMSVRFASAVSGVLTTFLVYKIVFLLVNMSSHKSKEELSGRAVLISLLSSMSIAVSPWLVHFSRGAWEANLSLTLTLFGVYFFLLSLAKPSLLILSSIFFSSTVLAYQGAKLSTPIVIFVLLVVFWKKIRFAKFGLSNLIISTAAFILITYPVVVSVFNGNVGRLEVFSVFSYPRQQEYLSNFLEKAGEKFGDLNYYLFHTESLNFFRGIAGRWFNHFSGRFLFFEGDYQNFRHSLPNHGMLQIFDIILLPFGIFYLIRFGAREDRLTKFIIFWLVLSPLPAVLSRDQVHAVRGLNMSIPLALLEAYGIYGLVSVVEKFKFRYFGFSAIFLLWIASFAYFVDSYFVHLPTHNAKYWYFGYKDVVKKVLSVCGDYDSILFKQSYDQPYIYFLFYGASFANDCKTIFDKNNIRLVVDGPDVGLVESLGKIRFEEFSYPPPTTGGKDMIIGDPVSIPESFSREDFNLIEEVKYPDGSVAFRIIGDRSY